jgi:hypothetical protein
MHVFLVLFTLYSQYLVHLWLNGCKGKMVASILNFSRNFGACIFSLTLFGNIMCFKPCVCILYKSILAVFDECKFSLFQFYKYLPC